MMDNFQLVKAVSAMIDECERFLADGGTPGELDAIVDRLIADNKHSQRKFEFLMCIRDRYGGHDVRN